jgi:hypothetical protein
MPLEPINAPTQADYEREALSIAYNAVSVAYSAFESEMTRSDADKYAVLSYLDTISQNLQRKMNRIGRF